MLTQGRLDVHVYPNFFAFIYLKPANIKGPLSGAIGGVNVKVNAFSQKLDVHM